MEILGMWTLRAQVGVGVHSCKIVLLRGRFLLTCPVTFAVGYIVYSHIAQHLRQTDR